MITQTGRKILGKYLINQVPAYASYLAFGCGATPSNPSYYNVFDNTKIASYQISGSSVTVTTVLPHNLETGQTIIVEFGDSRYNGTKTITVTGSTTFSYTANVTIPGITTITPVWTSTNALITYNTSSAHNLRVGDRVTTAFLAPSTFNITNLIAASTSSTAFSIYTTSNPGTATDTVGTVTLLNPTTIPSNVKFTVAPLAFEKPSLDFEMFRVPITSRSYVIENGIEKVILGGELPSQERYSITEMGVYSAGSNPYVSGSDSRMMFNFTETEGWDYASVSGSTVTKTPIISESFAIATAAPATYPAFSMSASDAIFDYSSASSNSVTRYVQHQQPRMLDSTVLLYGNVPTSYIELNGISANFDKNQKSQDNLKLAFSVIPIAETAYPTAPVYPNNIYFSITFLTSADLDLADQEYATDTFSITITPGNAYNVAKIKLSDFVLSNSNFSWSKVGAVRISAVARNSSNVAIDGYYIALDGMRFENEYDLINNPVYGLIGYSKIRDTVPVSYSSGGSTITNTHDVPVLKDQNTNNLAEFKFGLQLNSEV